MKLNSPVKSKDNIIHEL